MFRFRKRQLIPAIIFGLSFVILSILIPILRTPFFLLLKQPALIFISAGREIKGFIFYHRNYVQNELLKKEVGFLKDRLLKQEEISIENKRLKQLLSFKQSSNFRVVPVRVIGRSPDNWSSTVIIDKGRYHGIKEGMPAITYVGLAGRVIEADEYVSRVLLINDPGLGVSAIIQRTRQEGLVIGTLGNYLIMKYLPEDADVKVQDVVITSGLNATYPKGLLIGHVVSVGQEFSGLSCYAVIRPAVNLATIEELLVIVQ
ncbi:MAG: rod shape-determining protein MreC [Candidatus Omnitrophica bacterium]|nr:rod shape-determining protein MreC [Candidatus Omnitrophota bacterium]